MMRTLLYIIATALVAGFALTEKLNALPNTTAPTYRLTDKGSLRYLYFAGYDTVKLYPDGEFAGPALFFNEQRLSLEGTDGKYSGSTESLDYGLEYRTEGGSFVISVRCRNNGKEDLKNVQFSLLTGINTVMDAWPEWRSVYFPTLMRCEQTHFWGYLMTPNGSILTLASPDPVASYRLLYNNYKFKSWKEEFGSGHLIHSLVLDLLNPQPLPAGHPINADRLKRGETKTWTIYLGSESELAAVIPATASQTKGVSLSADVYTVAEGETVNLTVHCAAKPKITVRTPDGKTQSINSAKAEDGTYKVAFSPRSGKGVYRIKAISGRKTAEACVSLRYAWSDYIKSARRAALKYPQKGSSHVESWYGFFPASIAEEFFPDKAPDTQVEDMFKEVFPLMYDTLTNLPRSDEHRIQNHAIAASLHVQRYRAKGDVKELRAAARLADFLISTQSPDGAYRANKTHYTSVLYVAKSIMEVMAEEKKLAGASIEWRSNYRRHYNSVKLAIDELERNRDNIQTEGELTFEDAMISCSCTQLAAFGLLQPEGSAERQKYMDAAEYFYRSHRCLSQRLTPDSRVNGASLRFWESQYDILTCPNFLNSPHGWSALKIYGVKYLYEATGKEEYLLDMINALGACAQLLNPATDELKWSFVCDPYVKVKYFVEDEKNPGKGVRKDSIIGGQYLSMISDWYRAPKNKRVSGYWGYDGGCCDNDVHEIFKCMGEVALTSAYFHLRENGTYIASNCTVHRQNDKWNIKPAEPCVKQIYTNTDILTENDLTLVRKIKYEK
ncbi:MAG: hypothetical protein LBR10_12725 [Prevotellaceae bacterium]|jgi:hypothetical protein|nr:hypothetical protein [Prevotellaceae bacterium]